MKVDVISNYVVQLINVAFRFFLIPIYVNSLGPEGYGIASLYLSLEAIFALLDAGIGVYSAKVLAENGKNLLIFSLRSIEKLYVLFSIFIGGSFFLYSMVSPYSLVKLSNPAIDLKITFLLIAILLMVSWPKTLYENFLVGQKMILKKNIINLIYVFVRPLVILSLFTLEIDKIISYFIALISVNLLEILTLRFFSTKFYKVYKQENNRRNIVIFLKGIFHIGVFSLLSLFLFQLDKVYISNKLLISELTIYNLGATIPMVLLMIVLPITSAIFPRIVSSEGQQELKIIFLNWYELLFIATTLFFLISINSSFELLQIWLNKTNVDISLVSKTFKKILIGVYVQSFSSLIVTLFLAKGLSKLVTKVYGFSILIYILALLFLGFNEQIKLTQIADCWIIVNSSILLLSFYFLAVHYQSLFLSIISKLGKLSLLVFACFLIFTIMIPPIDNVISSLSVKVLIIFSLVFLFYYKRLLLFYKTI